MKSLTILSALTALALCACSSRNLPNDVRSVSIAPASKRAPLVLAPADSDYFSKMANEHSTWVLNELRSSIQRELASGGRFKPSPTGTGDAEITIDTLRHGLIEVSANQYAAQISGTATITQNGKQIGTRDLNGTSGAIRSLQEFESTVNYESALKDIMDKVALEMVNSL